MGKALRYLVDQGMLTESEDAERRGKIYRTTSRYQLQVRELAVIEAYDELLRLGASAEQHSTPALRVAGPDTLH